MTDSTKLAKLQRTQIEYERQRHLANWLIKSGPHMGKPPATQSPIVGGTTTTSTTPSKSSQKTQNNNNNNNNNSISHNPLFFMSKVNHVPPDLAIAHSQVLNSQQSITSLAIGAHAQKMPRFISQCSNMFSVDDFENARLQRRNELEMKQRQINRYKKSSLSSGGDCSTGDSKGSKFSNESNHELLPAELFLERFSLPRVVRVVQQKVYHEATSSSSNVSAASTPTSNSPMSTMVATNTSTIDANAGNVVATAANVESTNGGELFLLYRYLRNRKIYHGVNAKNGASRKKGVLIPQEFSGYFSLINDKGAPTATLYTTITKLVREKVYKFLSVDNLTAYTESQNTDTFPPRPHYVKGTARGGQVFRLLAVFEDGKQNESSGNQHSSSSTFKSGNNAGRYAQLLNESRQIIYVSLTSKGKFYEIEDTNATMRSSTMSETTNGGSGTAATRPKQDFADCVHRIANIVPAEIDLPITIRFISGPQNCNSNIPEQVTIAKVTTENCVFACPIDENEIIAPLQLQRLILTSEMRLMKSFLGFDSELKMFSNQNVQNILKYCQLNCDTFIKNVDTEILSVIKERAASTSSMSNGKMKSEGLKILRPLNFPKLLRREKSLIAHEKEDSIIFLSKNDLENMENKERQLNKSSGGMFNDKMKVFQTTKKKWFRNVKTSAPKETSATTQSKRMSLDRYQEMSKLLQERFGGVVGASSNQNAIEENNKCEMRANSEIGVNVDQRRATIDSSELRQKSYSMQDFDSHSEYSIKPDLVNVDFVAHGRSVDDDSVPINGDGNDSLDEDAEVFEMNNQKSFITEKLCNEFHVKTKCQNKTMSNSLQQLLHFSVPQKMNVNDARKTDTDEVKPNPMPMTDYSLMVNASFDDDLPYSNVRDSLVLQTSNSDTNEAASSDGMSISNTENIYAEICADYSLSNVLNGNQSKYNNNNRNDDTIRISIGSSSNSFEAGPSSMRHSSTDSSSLSDNVYNTLK